MGEACNWAFFASIACSMISCLSYHEIVVCHRCHSWPLDISCALHDDIGCT